MRLISKKTFFAILIPLCFIITFVVADLTTTVTFDDTVTPTMFTSTSLPIKLTTTSGSNTYSLINLNSSLVGWWRFENALTDDSGFGNTGTNGTQYVAGKFGQAFNSSGDYITLGTLTGELSGSVSTFTMGAWVRRADTVYTDNTIVGDTQSKSISLGSDHKVSFGITDVATTNYNIDSTTALSVNTWYHVTATYDATTGSKLYINGVEEATAAGHGALRASDTYSIGSVADDAILIDDVVLFNRVLTAAEALSLYNSEVNEYSRTFTVATTTSHTVTGYAVDVDAVKVNTGARTITYATVPTITASAATGLTRTAVILNASVSSDGAASTTDRGFYYGSTVAYGSVASTTSSGGVGSFSQSLAGLTCNRTYHYSAFATNYAGTATTSDATITTRDCASRVAPGSSNTTPTEETTSSTTSTTTTNASTTNTTTPTEEVVVENNTSTTEEVVIAPRFIFRNNLQFRTNNGDVLELQRFLNANGFTVADDGAGSPGNETRYFGMLTFKALKKFQAQVGIFSTGFFGPITRAFINGI